MKVLHQIIRGILSKVSGRVEIGTGTGAGLFVPEGLGSTMMKR